MKIKKEWLKDLSPTEAILYGYILENPTKWKQEEIAEDLNLTRPTINSALAGLSDKGYIHIHKLGNGKKSPKRYIPLKD